MSSSTEVLRATETVDELSTIIEEAAHSLPSQGPITVFVHHNTLHALEDSDFDEAVTKGAKTYGCRPFLSEARYRTLLGEGRIRTDDLSAALLDDLGESSDELIGLVGTRFHLRMAMLEHPLFTGEDAELRWLVDETDALERFRCEADDTARARTVGETRRWVGEEFGNGSTNRQLHDTAGDLLRRYGGPIERWNDRTWETFTLHLLWRVCHQGVHGLPRFKEPDPPCERHRDCLLRATGLDVDHIVDPLLIRFTAAFLDQGFATWELPDRDAGYLRSFLALYRTDPPADRRLRQLPAEIARLEVAELDPLACIEDSLARLGVFGADRQPYVTQTLLALRGWAGMIHQMETNAEWANRPAPHGTLTEYLAVRLLLERLALRSVVDDARLDVDLATLRTGLRRSTPREPRVSVDERAYLVFQLAQVRGWSPLELQRMSRSEWSRLVEEIEGFPTDERSRIYHSAYERRYRLETLNAIAEHTRRTAAEPEPSRPTFQVFCCIDDREESFRRHLEEVAPACETFGSAGFYGVAMFYRGVSAAHFTPLCPVSIQPRHWVGEEVAYSFEEVHRRRARARRTLGAATRRFHLGSRSFLGGIGAAFTGSLATIPLVARTLFPWRATRLQREFRRIVDAPTVTQLRLERNSEPTGPAPDQMGYSLEEMADIVKGLLVNSGAVAQLAPIVLVLGHGSASLNNPHASAYNCGACSGGRGGPNARAVSQMANDLRVRGQLARQGVEIPADTYFIGGYHNTCDDSVTYYDLERIPPALREAFHEVRLRVDEARERNAHERCRRFESAPLTLARERALRHVEERSDDLSQVRPEYNHATNALCIVGRRRRTRGLFLDRRAFLTSYDPTTDDEEATTLERLLQAVIPVCAGISLEYYFSTVDVQGYGCGSKLPHNIVSLLGVMEGAASDLRPGLSAQMVEIHEPMRILFVIESTPRAVAGIMARNPAIDRLVRNRWVQLAVQDHRTSTFSVWDSGGFVPHVPEGTPLPVCGSSAAWYGGQRGHLGFASVASAAVTASVEETRR